MQFLSVDQTSDDVGQNYETPVTFLQSSDSEKLKQELKDTFLKGRSLL